MKLHTVYFGRAKSRMKPIMTDDLRKCENYVDSRVKSGVSGWHEIKKAEPDAKVWRQKTCTIRGGGDKTNSGPLRVGRGPSGYISKHGFEHNT